MSEAQALAEATAAIRGAYALLQQHKPLLDRFEREARDLESVGPVLAPSLYLRAQREPWRKDVRAAFQAAGAFIAEIDRLGDSLAKRGVHV